MVGWSANGTRALANRPVASQTQTNPPNKNLSFQSKIQLMSKTIASFFKGDPVIWVIYFFLCIISLIEVFSAASTLAYESGSFWMPLVKQAAFLTAGTIVVLVVHNVHYRFFKTFPLLFLGGGIVFSIVMYASGARTNEAARWVDLGFVQFQPSELLKLGMMAAAANILASNQREHGADPTAFKHIVGILLVCFALIFSENFSTAGILAAAVFILMFIGRVPLKQLGALMGVGMIALSVVAALVMIPDKDSKIYDTSGFHRFQTWRTRVEKFTTESDSVTPATYDIVNNRQVAHANIAIASSNIVGRIPGNSVERDFLSQAFSDFIFAIIIEEMGIEGALVVVSLYVILLFRAGRIAARCERNFPAFLAMGLALLMVLQAMTNMMVAVGLIPVTGQPLPLISRGGTSTLITCLYFGILLSISRYARRTEHPQHTNFDDPDE